MSTNMKIEMTDSVDYFMYFSWHYSAVKPESNISSAFSVLCVADVTFPLTFFFIFFVVTIYIGNALK
jgi:hypothetical protein